MSLGIDAHRASADHKRDAILAATGYRTALPIDPQTHRGRDHRPIPQVARSYNAP